MKWRTLSSDIAYDGSPFFILRKETVETRKGRKIYPWYKMEDSDFAIIIPITQDNNVVMIEQYRHGIERVSLELPSGSLEPGESHEDAAKRELLEETGYEGSLVKLGDPIAEDVSMKTNMFHIYLAKNAKKISCQKLDPNEDIRIVIKPLKDAIKACFDGSIVNAPSIISLLFAANYLQL